MVSTAKFNGIRYAVWYVCRGVGEDCDALKCPFGKMCAYGNYETDDLPSALDKIAKEIGKTCDNPKKDNA